MTSIPQSAAWSTVESHIPFEPCNQVLGQQLDTSLAVTTATAADGHEVGGGGLAGSRWGSSTGASGVAAAQFDAPVSDEGYSEDGSEVDEFADGDVW